MEKIIAIFIAVFTSLYFLKRFLRGASYNKNTLIDGKVVIITGANSGIGFESAVDLAARGGKVYIACRDKKRAEDALDKIKKRSGSENVYFLRLDLASLNSIENFVINFKSLENRLDILLNNAGIVGVPGERTKEGFELHMGVNHLGHFYLTHLLLDTLKKSTPSRIINVSSLGHKWANRDDLFSESSYNFNVLYMNSKLANNLFTYELSKRLRGTGVDVNCCHPGVVGTDIVRHSPKWVIVIARLLGFVIKTPKDGAQTQIRLALDPALEGVTGKYFSDCELKEPSKDSVDDALAKWAWNKSEELVKIKFGKE